MLPSEEYAYLKRKYEQEKRSKAQPKTYSIDPVDFANATHGIPPAYRTKRQHFQLKTVQANQPRYIDKKRPAAIATARKEYATVKTVKAGQPNYISERQRAKSVRPIIEQTAPRPAQAPRAKPARPTPRYPAPQKPLPVPDYSSTQFRKYHVYRPSGLSGKAREVLGVAEKKIYANKPPPRSKSKGSKSACLVM